MRRFMVKLRTWNGPEFLFMSLSPFVKRRMVKISLLFLCVISYKYKVVPSPFLHSRMENGSREQKRIRSEWNRLIMSSTYGRN